MNNIEMEKVVEIAQLVLALKKDGISTNVLISALASAIDMLIAIDNLDFKETWKRAYIASQVIHELS